MDSFVQNGKARHTYSIANLSRRPNLWRSFKSYMSHSGSKKNTDVSFWQRIETVADGNKCVYISQHCTC